MVYWGISAVSHAVNYFLKSKPRVATEGHLYKNAV